MKAEINVEFNQAVNRQEIQSGDEIKTLFGKLKKWLADLKPVAFSGSYNDLSDTPSSLPANGGEAERSVSDSTGADIAESFANVRSNIAINRSALGCVKRNLLKNNAVTQTVSGVTFTINDDKSITVNGTATAQISFIINNKVGLGIGNYILTGCPSGGSWNTFYLTAYASSAWLTAPDFGSGCKIENKTVTQVVISIASGYTANNLKFYPMLRDAEIIGDAYETYQPSLKEELDSLRDYIDQKIAEISGI